MRLVVRLERDETGMVVAEYPLIPGCISQGRTEDEALESIREALAACVQARAASGMPVTVASREIDVAV
jgi:predicted RNase H-like HicB family nuclease